MILRQGNIVELDGSRYYVLEVSGGIYSQDVSGKTFFHRQPDTVVLKLVELDDR